MAKHPPVPPENRSPHESDAHRAPAAGSKSTPDREPKNPDKHGQQANTRQNTTNQGYQQDR
jgi:hypothetical protein